ncbi:MAG: AbrB/MazE/SpoVT family DNA-binding domain-containing protein [Candidatus Omnitrophica bacterium]|nr:AbrB/MazE/SpoVT family DNA-binding domain-containing protein [Candidatus Omnitrophota bacterium]
MTKFHGPKMHGAVTVGARGQVVIPADVREAFGIKAGDKLIVFTKDREFINLIPGEQFNGFLSHMTKMLANINKGKLDI